MWLQSDMFLKKKPTEFTEPILLELANQKQNWMKVNTSDV